jgi:DNA-binding NarL/FixJ family response regulator/uncharacterized protein involved in exopolysaccharide biosynthesis
MIRILLVDDQRSIRETLKMMLDSAPDFQVVGTASDGHTAIEQVELLNPDVVLIDMEMPGLDGVSATRIINQQFSDVKVLVLSMHDDDTFISQSMQAGAMGYLLKTTPPQELRAAIRFVNRGYAQIGPGLLDKMVAVEEQPETHELQNGHNTPGHNTTPFEGIAHSNGSLSQNQSVLSQKLARAEAAELGELGPDTNGNGHSRRNGSSKLALSPYESELTERGETNEPDSLRNGRWRRYLFLGLLINAILWMAAISVLKYKRPIYTSSWTLDLPATRADTFLEVPGVGRAAETNVSPYSNIMVADPRANYKDLLAAPEVVKAAAGMVHMPVDEFVPPRVEVVPNTTLMKLAVNGKSPQDAYQNAIAVQSAFSDKITALRQQELAQQNKSLKVALDASSERLKLAQQRLSSYKVQSGLDSGEQLRDFSVNIEALRRQRAETVAQAQDSSNQLRQLSATLGLSSQQAGDAFILQSDAIFQQYLLGFSKTSADLTTLEAAYSSDHPKTVDKAEEKAAARTKLFQRGAQLLGHPMSEANLQQINVSNGISSNTERGGLFQELIKLKGKEAGLRGQFAALDEQIRQQEGQMISLSKKKSILVNLERDVQIAEAIFTSTLGKLDLTKSSFSAAYPEISVRTKPSLPRIPSSPKAIPILLGTFLGSVLVSAGLAALWYRDRRQQRYKLEKASSPALDRMPVPPQLKPSNDRMLQSLPGQE